MNKIFILIVQDNKSCLFPDLLYQYIFINILDVLLITEILLFQFRIHLTVDTHLKPEKVILITAKK